MNYGLVLDNALLFDPIADHTRLLDKAARQGFPVGDIRTPLTQEVVIVTAGRTLQILPANETLGPPPAETGFAGQWSAWQIDTDNLCLTREYKYLPMGFELCLQDLKRHISRQQDNALAFIEQGYTAQEVKTWAQQQAEAAAWEADITASVPLLTNLAQRRGVTVEVVVDKISTKVATAATLTGIVLGDAQAAGDQLAALNALAEADNLPDDWFNQLQAIATGWKKEWPPELL